MYLNPPLRPGLRHRKGSDLISRKRVFRRSGEPLENEGPNHTGSFVQSEVSGPIGRESEGTGADEFSHRFLRPISQHQFIFGTFVRRNRHVHARGSCCTSTDYGGRQCHRPRNGGQILSSIVHNLLQGQGQMRETSWRTDMRKVSERVWQRDEEDYILIDCRCTRLRKECHMRTPVLRRRKISKTT